MLVSLTRVGAARQDLDKAVAVLGADPAEVIRRLPAPDRPGDGAVRISPFGDTPGLFTIGVSAAWLGTRPARDEVFASLRQGLDVLGAAAAAAGGTVLPTGVAMRGKPAVLGGDTHILEVLSPVEQEVLGNLLRSHVPTLIAMAGRGVTGTGLPPDRIGSRWLMESRSHLATRFLASTTSTHLDRVKAELRRRDGVQRLDRMDVAPGESPAGGLVVVVRCLDAAASLATARAHALVLAAFGLRARRLVRDGERAGNERQRLLEENRARAIAEGFRARFALADRAQSSSAHRGSASQHDRAPRRIAARQALRALLADLSPELANLDSTVEELAPVIFPIELPQLGLRRVGTDAGLLSGWATQGEATLIRASRDGLRDLTAGGPVLRQSSDTAPGRVSIVLDLWRRRLAGTPPGPAKQADHRGGGRAGQGGSKPRRGDRPGQHGGGSR